MKDRRQTTFGPLRTMAAIDAAVPIVAAAVAPAGAAEKVRLTII